MVRVVVSLMVEVELMVWVCCFFIQEVDSIVWVLVSWIAVVELMV